MTIRTALLDARLILGDEVLFAEFQHRFREDVLEGNARAFVDAKLAEQNARHARAGASRYLVEPNIKDGKGGLRDLHTLHWLAKHLYPDKAEAAIRRGRRVHPQANIAASAAARASSGRCAASCISSPTVPRSGLSFDVQPLMAERLGYRGHAGLRAVERFMKHYFLVAKEVGELTRIVCSALEMKQLKSLPSLGTLLSPVQLETPRAASPHLRLPHRERPHQRHPQGRFRQGPGELHPPVRRCRRAAGDRSRLRSCVRCARICG